MRSSTILLAGTALLAVATPVAAQTGQEGVAQAVNTPDQDADEAIIVTATKRATTVQDVPFSINAQTEEDIQRANAQTIEDISRNVAGLAVTNLGPGQSQVSVRGVSAGQIVRDQPGVKEQVGVYLDESVISLSLFTPDLDLFDLNRVETLRGPQGTLFGSSSVGGTLRYITNQPRLGRTEGLAEANINVLAGGDIGYHAKGAINIPLGDTVAIRAVGYGTHYAGFVDAVGPAGGDNVNDGNRVGGRIALLFQPSDSVRVTPRVVYQKVRANGFNREEFYNFYDNQFTSGGGASLEDGRTHYLKLREDFKDDTLIADLTASIGFGAVELTSVTSYIDREILVSRDASALTASVSTSPLLPAFPLLNPAIQNLPSNLVDTTDLKQWTQELRVASTGSGPLQWVIGGFYSDIERFYRQRLPTPGYDAFIEAVPALTGASAGSANGFPLNSPYNSDIPYDFKQSALFGEASYDFGQFKVTGGARIFDYKETRDFVSGGIFSNVDTRTGDRNKSSGVSPRLILTYEPNRNFSVNLQAAKGFRLGGINDPVNAPLCSGGATGPDALTYGNRPTYDDETLWNYEAGVKYQAGGITMNAAVFHNDIKDLQMSVDAGSCSSRVTFNVPKAHSTGLEAEFSARAGEGWDVSVAGSLINAEFDADVLSSTGAVIAGMRDGNRLPTVPKFQVAATTGYTRRLTANMEGFFTASFQHVSSRITQSGDQEDNAFLYSAPSNTGMLFFDPATGAYGQRTFDWGDLSLPAYDLVNLSAGMKFDSGLEVVAYVNNLFDENPKLSLDRERGGRARLGYNIGQPRTVGLTIRQSFGR